VKSVELLVHCCLNARIWPLMSYYKNENTRTDDLHRIALLSSFSRSRERNRAQILSVELPISIFSFHTIVKILHHALTREHRAHWFTKPAHDAL
jgi:hypothetical protein